MGSSFVGFYQRGFWLADGLLQIWLHYLAGEVNTFPEAPEWLIELGDIWRIQAQGICTGCIYTGLDEYVTSLERAQTTLAVAKQALLCVEKKPPFLSKDELNRLGLGVTWRVDVSTDKIIELGRQFMLLFMDETI